MRHTRGYTIVLLHQLQVKPALLSVANEAYVWRKFLDDTLPKLAKPAAKTKKAAASASPSTPTQKPASPKPPTSPQSAKGAPAEGVHVKGAAKKKAAKGAAKQPAGKSPASTEPKPSAANKASANLKAAGESAAKPAKAKRALCKKQHPMTIGSFAPNYTCAGTCAVMHQTSPNLSTACGGTRSDKSYHCEPCRYDLCFTCANVARADVKAAGKAKSKAKAKKAPPAPKRPHACPTCNTAFAARSHMNQHRDSLGYAPTTRLYPRTSAWVQPVHQPV